MQLEWIPPLRFATVGMTDRRVALFIHTGYIRYVAWRWLIAATWRGSIQHGLSEKSFYYWQKKLRTQIVASAPELVPQKSADYY